MKLTITKRFKFEAAHYLRGYAGPCGHIHGHSYTLELSIGSRGGLIESGQERGMVADLTRIKTLVQPIIDSVDHTLIVEEETTAWIIGGGVGGGNEMVASPEEHRTYILGERPTTENLAIHLWDRIAEVIPVHAQIQKIKLIETETSWVELENE